MSSSVSSDLLGLPEAAQKECSTLRQNLVAPFRDIYRIVRGT